MKKIKLLLFLLLAINLKLFAQGGASSCAELAANPNNFQTCASNINFSSSSTPSNESFFPTCFGGNSLVAPSWFLFTIENPGNVILQISQTDANTGQGIDVDFALYGPFNNLNNLCANINNGTQLDCSYSAAAVETVTVPNSNTGDMYVIVIDNYAALQGQSGPITVNQIGGTGTTNCDFLSSVRIKNTDNTDITQFDYCKPTIKEITAFIDTSDFTGNIADLRFNYSWFKDNIQIGTTIQNSTSPQNTIQVTETGTYKVIITAYDVVNNPNQNNPVPTESESEVELKFHTIPNITLTNTNTICLNTNPSLSVTINNSASLDNTIDVLTYEWYLNNVIITGATGSTYIPSAPGKYFAKVINLPCNEVVSNEIQIYANPLVTIQNNQTICENDTYTITSANANASLNSNVTYEWYKDGVLTNVTTPNYIVSSSNQTPNTTSTYYVIATEEGTCTNTSNTVSITINALPVVNTIPVDLEQCDYLNNTTDGFAETNLTQLYDYITNSTLGLTLYYYTDSGLTNLINDPEHFFNTTAFNQPIYVQAVNENVTPNCTSNGISSINLQINPTSPSSYPNIAPVCPEVNQQYGYIDFETQRQLIKNTYFPTSSVIISFHLTQSDASTGVNEQTNTSQIPVGTTLIHTKVISTGTKDCLAIGTFNVTVFSAPTLNSIQNENLCLLDTFYLNTKDIEALTGQSPTVSSSYFSTFEGARDNDLTLLINKNSQLSLVLGNTTYYIRLFDSATGCFSIVNFNINVFPNPTLTTPDPIKHCGNVTADFDLNSRINQITGGNTNYQVLFYASASDLASNTPIVNTSQYNSTTTTIYIKVNDPTNLNCEATTTLNLVVLTLPGNTSNPTPIELCNDSGYETFNLRIRENEMSGTTPINDIVFKYYKNINDAIANTNNNLIGNPTQYTNTIINFEKVYVRLTSRSQIDSETNIPCFRILELDLYVRHYPENNLLNRPYTICVDQANNIVYPVEIVTGLNETDYTFVWYTGFNAVAGNEIIGETGNVFSTDIVGDYSVQITNISNAANCSSVFNFTTVNSLIPNNFSVSPQELIGFETENTVSVTASPASADYLYSIDNFSWQESPIFTNLQPGSYSVYVTNKFGCGDLTTSFTILDYPKFFTPNNDGYNDTWNIIGAEILDNSSIHIFDRYGKLIKQISPLGEGWNGTYNGKLLPSDDYWFIVYYTKNGVSKEFKSHFTLTR